MQIIYVEGINFKNFKRTLSLKKEKGKCTGNCDFNII
jgi:hypothetical protein